MSETSLHQNNHDNGDDGDGIYENYNVDYDNDYDQFYDKPPPPPSLPLLQQHYLMQDSSIAISPVGRICPRIHQHHLYDMDNESMMDHDQFIIDNETNDHHPQIHYFYEEDGQQHDGLENVMTIDPTLIQHYHQQTEHQTETDILSDARIYGLPTFLHHHQQQIQRHMLAVPDGTNGSIYGNPLVYSLHTIYEESENESSLQTLSSLTSTSMTIQTDGQSLENPMTINSDKDSIVTTVADEELSLIHNSTGDQNKTDNQYHPSVVAQHYSIIVSKPDYKISDNSDADSNNKKNPRKLKLEDCEEDEEDEDIDLVAIPYNDSIMNDTLTSKLERYFTSGLLETMATTITNNNKNNNHNNNIIGGVNIAVNDTTIYHHHDDHQYQQQAKRGKIFTEQLSSNYNGNIDVDNNGFDKIGNLCNFLNKIISGSSSFVERRQQVTDDEKSENVSEYLNQLGHIFKMDFKRFIIQMISILRSYTVIASTSITDETKFDNRNIVEQHYCQHQCQKRHDRPQLMMVAEHTIERLLQQHSKSKLERCFITLFIECIYSLTQIDYLLFDYRLWIKFIDHEHHYQPQHRFIMMKNMVHQEKTSLTNSKSDGHLFIPTGKTIIKVTVNGRLLATNTGDNDDIKHQHTIQKSINSQPTASIKILNTEPLMVEQQIRTMATTAIIAKNLEYRTILQVNNQSDCDDKQWSSKFLYNDNYSVDGELEEGNNVEENSLSSRVVNNENKLSKFLRVSNPLNRSFLAKILPAKDGDGKQQQNNREPGMSHTINGEVSVACWANEAMMIEQVIDDYSLMSHHHGRMTPLSSSSSSPRRCCSTEQIQELTQQKNRKISSNNSHQQPNTSLKNGKSSSTISPGHHHRNSFRNSTLDHIYEMLKSPFKSSKKHKKSSVDSAGCESDSENRANCSTSKSLSEPNLNGRLKRLNQQYKNNLDYNNCLNTTTANSQNSSLDPLFDHCYLDLDDQKNKNVSKSTPQLLINHHQNKNGVKQLSDDNKLFNNKLDHRSWTGSWDRRLHINGKSNDNYQYLHNRHKNSAQKAKSSKNIEDLENHDNDDEDSFSHNNQYQSKLNDECSIPGQMKPVSGLQRSLSGSQTSSNNYTVFQRPKSSFIVCNDVSKNGTNFNILEVKKSMINNKENNDDVPMLVLKSATVSSSSQPIQLLGNYQNHHHPIKSSLSSLSQQQKQNKNSSSFSSSTSSSSSSSSSTKSSSYRKINKVRYQSSQKTSATTGSLISSYKTTASFKNHFDGDYDKDDDYPTFSTITSTMPLIGKICLSIYYENKLNSLTITIFRCHLNMVKKHKNDLYIKIYILADHQQEKAFKKKTKIRKALKVETSNGPVYEVEYNEILRFNGKWREFNAGQLSVSLWNNDTFGRNTLLGQAMIRLNEQVMFNSIQTRIWHDLLQQTKIKCQSVHVKGSLFLAVKYDDNSQISSINNYEEPISGGGGDLQVLIKEANDLNLNQYNINGYSYCKILLKPERNKEDYQKTKMVKMGQSPRWNETFTFKNVKKHDLNVKELEIAIMWQDKSSKTYLGSLRLTNHEDASNEERNVWKQMIERPNLWAYGKIPLRH